MNNELSEPLLGKLSEIIESRMGLCFPRERWKDLNRGIARASRELKFKDVENCCEWLLTSSPEPSQVEALASHLTVGETYFFRDPACFQALEHEIIPEWVRSNPDAKQPLRIWSAGCSTGEEPYTIAMLLDKFTGGLKGREVTVLATDINTKVLHMAKRGVYGKWSFRKTSPSRRERYFDKVSENAYQVKSRYRSMVTFSYLNLVDDTYPSLLNHTNAIDIIFCRNVLMYFSEKRRQEVLRRFYRSLTEGGWLVVSSIEAAMIQDAAWSPVRYPGSFLFCKKNRSAGAEKQPLPEPDRVGLLIERGNFNPDQKTGRDAIPGVRGVQYAHPPIYTNKFEIPIPKPVRPIPVETASPARKPGLPSLTGLYEEALRLFEHDHHAEAGEKLGCILALEKDNIKAISLMARVRANQGQLFEALEWCDKALAGDKLNPALHYLLATILLELNRGDEARTALKRVLYLAPDFIPASFVLGNLAWQNGKMKEARRHFEHAISRLKGYSDNDVISESGGLTAGRLIQIMSTLLSKEAVA